MLEKVRISCDQLIDANLPLSDELFSKIDDRVSSKALMHALKQLPVDQQRKKLETYFGGWLNLKCYLNLIDRELIPINADFSAIAVFFRTEEGQDYINDMMKFIDHYFELKPNFNLDHLIFIANAFLLLTTFSIRFHETFIRFFTLYPQYVPKPDNIYWAIKKEVSPQFIALMLQRVTVTNDMVRKLEAAKNEEVRKLAPFAEKALQEFHGSVLDLLKSMGGASAGPGPAAADR